ncbi:MAG: hypothetical protein ACYC6A_20850 [Armatimonadota bacterium]
MPNEIVVAERGGQVAVPLTKEQIIDRVSLIQKIMADNAIMKEGVHYGPPNGKKNDEQDDDKKLKPVLLQPGAEKLMLTFRLAADFPDIEKTIGPDGSITYEVRCTITDQMTGAFLGAERGTCSTLEEKYHWKRCYIQGEYDAAPEAEKRIKWRTDSYQKNNVDGLNPGRKEYQIRVNPADVANTVLAIACKRAKVRAVRAACAASDIFDVNTEDLPEELRPGYDDDHESKPAKVPDAMNRRQNPGTAKPAQPAAPKQGDPKLGAYVINFGKYKDDPKTLAELGEKSVSWYAENARDEKTKNAAQAYLDSLHAPAEEPAPVPGGADDVPPLDDSDVPDITDPFKDE